MESCELAVALYILEQGVVEFGASFLSDCSEEEAIDGRQNQGNNHQHAINKLVEVQLWVFCDIIIG